MKKVEVVAAIIRSENKILCCQRESNKLAYLSNKWEFPGGKLETGETQKQALIREIDEELEMDIKNIEFALTVVHPYPDFELTMHAYFAEVTNTDYKLHAHLSAEWSSIKELDILDWAAADIPIVDFLQRQL